MESLRGGEEVHGWCTAGELPEGRVRVEEGLAVGEHPPLNGWGSPTDIFFLCRFSDGHPRFEVVFEVDVR